MTSRMSKHAIRLSRYGGRPEEGEQNALEDYLKRAPLLLLGAMICCTAIFLAGCSQPVSEPTLSATPMPVTRPAIPPSDTSILPTETGIHRPSTPEAPATETAGLAPTSTPEPTRTPRPLLPLRIDADQGEILCSIYPEGDIGSVKADGSEMTILMDTPASLDIYDNRHATWLPDGNRFSYTIDDFSQAEIWLADVQGGEAQLLLGDVAADSSHSWSPDGQSIAYVSTSNQIIRYNLATQARFQLTDEHFRWASDPDWSPDGSRIAFSAIEGGNQDIYLIDIDGTNLVRVTIPAEIDQAPAWSPDGTKIVFSSARDGDQIKDLFIIDLSQGTEAEGNIPKQLTFADTLDIDPDWSPDGQYIVYAAHTFGAAHATLFIIDVNGERRFQLTKENTYHSPRWRP